MKKISILIILIFTFYINIEKNNDFIIESNQNINAINKSEEILSSVTDYPLIDIPIRYSDSNIFLIICNDILISDQSEYFLADDKNILEKMQCNFNVTTFPKGHGTTPDSCVYVYQDNILIREIPFVGVYNNDEYNLTKYTKKDLELYLNLELPEPF